MNIVPTSTGAAKAIGLDVAAKPATVKVKALPLKKVKDMALS